MMRDFIFLALLAFIINARADTSVCTSKDPMTVEHPDCTKFYYCIDGVGYVAQCHAGYYYSEKGNGCVKATTCPQPIATTSSTTTTTTIPPPLKPVAPCENLNITVFENEDDCRQFTYCLNGIPHTMLCPSGYLYSNITKGCIQTTQCPQEITTPSNTTTTTSTTTTTIKPSSALVPPCASMEETIAIPSDCSMFVICVDGRPFIKQCSIGEFYSAETGDCIKASTCPQRTT